MNIGFSTSVYFNNIGNAFIDMGAQEVVKAAMNPDDALIPLSQCENFAASMGPAFVLKENPFVHWTWTKLMKRHRKSLHDKAYKTISSKPVFSINSLFDLDVLILPGCILTVPFFTIFEDMLARQKEAGCKFIFLGASGNHYTPEEIQFVKDKLKALRPYALISRDSIAFQQYKDCFKHAYNGIDNAFFLNRISLPDTAPNRPYVVINLEEEKNQALKKQWIQELTAKNQTVVFSDHKPFPYAKVSRQAKEENMLISDTPMDYLLLYKNAQAVYSDRVHACIPTLTFGHPATLYSDSPRIALFENAGIHAEAGRPMTLEHLKERQDKEIAFLQSILQTI